MLLRGEVGCRALNDHGNYIIDHGKIMEKSWNFVFEFLWEPCLGVKVTRNVTQYPLHHVIYAPTKFEVATSNPLGEDTITRNVTDGRTDAQTDGRRTDFGTKLIYPIFLTKKRV